MKLSEVRDHLVTLYQHADERYAICLRGKPGIGKSAIVKQAADSLGIDFRAPPPLPVIDPLDLGGLGAVITPADGSAPYALRLPFSELIPPIGQGIILFDDITTAPQLTQAAMYSLIWERRIGSSKLGDGWLIVCTANRDEDNAATNPIPTPLVNRMEFLEVEEDIEAWFVYMAGVGRSPIVRAFIHNHPTRFIDFDANRPGPFSSSRSWENVAVLFDAYAKLGRLPPEPAIAGWVGPGDAIQITAFARAHGSLVSPAAVLADPSGAPIPDDPGALVVILLSLADHARYENIDKIITYFNRVRPEMAIFGIRMAMAAQTGRFAKLANEGVNWQRAVDSKGKRTIYGIEESSAFQKYSQDHVKLLTD